MRTLIKAAAASIGFEIQRSNRGTKQHATEFLEFFRRPDQSPELAAFLTYAALNATRSNSQLFQDLFTLNTLHEKRNGYFVEFGATDGLTLNNTALLEREYGWNGILAEPARCWHEAILSNRNCKIDRRCVWKVSGETLSFSETEYAELSTVTDFSKSDYNDRSVAKQYGVETVSLNDLLHEHDAPSDIDYLSIDTEGSEFVILQAMDFSKWSIRIITVEHNFNLNLRRQIFDLLTSKGYRRCLSEITRFDDWYTLSV